MLHLLVLRNLCSMPTHQEGDHRRLHMGGDHLHHQRTTAMQVEAQRTTLVLRARSSFPALMPMRINYHCWCHSKDISTEPRRDQYPANITTNKVPEIVPHHSLALCNPVYHLRDNILQLPQCTAMKETHIGKHQYTDHIHIHPIDNSRTYHYKVGKRLIVIPFRIVGHPQRIQPYKVPTHRTWRGGGHTDNRAYETTFFLQILHTNINKPAFVDVSFVMGSSAKLATLVKDYKFIVLLASSMYMDIFTIMIISTKYTFLLTATFLLGQWRRNCEFAGSEFTESNWKITLHSNHYVYHHVYHH